MATHLTRSDCDGSSAVDGTDDMLWNLSEYGDSDPDW